MKISPTLLLIPLILHNLSMGAESQTLNHNSPPRELQDTDTEGKYEFNVHTHNEHFKRIKENLKAIEQSYIDCVLDLSDNDFSEETVNDCVGNDLIYVTNDITYERKKMIGRADKKIRDYLLEYCYKVAGLNEVQSNGCDILEKDVLDLLWIEMNIESTIDYHRHKYLFTYGEVPSEAFEKIIIYLRTLYQELRELITEIDHHGLLSNANIKSAIDRRTQQVLDKAREHIDNPLPKIYKHVIEIQEKINEPSRIEVDHLPRPVVMDNTNKLYTSHNNPYVEEFHKSTGYKYSRMSNTNAINATNYGPIVTIPDRKLMIDSDSKLDK